MTDEPTCPTAPACKLIDEPRAEIPMLLSSCVRIRPVLRACMIDGFGWFQTADYRRAWLSFDSVSYVFPVELTGPTGTEFTLAQPALTDDAVEAILAAARADTAAPVFRETLATIPGRDCKYASSLVACDRQFARRFLPAEREDPGFGIALLLNKLLWFANDTNSVPIVGRSYANALLEWKLSKAAGARIKHTYRAFSAERRGSSSGLSRRWSLRVARARCGSCVLAR